MSGHSKWSTIKRQKGANDVRRGATFTKLANAITIAVREGGGGDPSANFRLRLSIDKAREANMPKENIQRAVDRGLGKEEGLVLENVLYEGFAPFGVAVLVEVVTDNRNRTNGEVRTAFSKAEGSLGGSGSVGYLFKHAGELTVGKNEPFDLLFEKTINAGGEDLVETSDTFLIYTQPSSLHNARVSLETQGVVVSAANLIYIPNRETLVNIVNEDQAKKVMDLIETLEEMEDVQNVFNNLA